jgi:PPOX class probable F420-dependent enzyme
MKTIPASHLDILEAKGLSFVTTVRPDGLLSVHPVSVIAEPGELRFSTMKDRGKVRNLRHDDRISVCIPDPANPLRYVEVRGRARIEDDPDRAFIDRIAREFMGLERYPYDPPDTERVTIVVEIEQVSVPRVHGSTA